MTEQEISVKLTETEQRAKSNTHRIEKLEQQQKDLNKLVTAVEVLASREKGVETDVKEIKHVVAVLFRYNVFSVKGVHFITPLLLIFVPSMKKATRYNQVASLMIEQ